MIALLAGSAAADAGDAFCLEFTADEAIYSHPSTGQVGSIITTEKFSWGCWLKTDAPNSGGNGQIFSIAKDGELVEPQSLVLSFIGDDNSVSCFVVSTTGGLSVKQFQWFLPGAPTSNQWVHYVFTFDGTASLDPLLIYENGSDITGTVTKTLDNTGTWVWEPTAHVAIGADVTFSTWPTEDGLHFPNENVRIHSAFLWNDLLTAAEIAVLYHGGDGRTVNLDRNRGSYLSSAALVLWYRLGLDPDNYGKDYSGSGIHLTEEHNLSAADRFRDSPA